MKGKRKKKGLKLVHVIIIFLVIYVGFTFWNQNKLMSNLQIKKDQLAKELEALNKDIENLTEEIETSDSLQFVEKVARDELRMVKPREIMIIDTNKNKKAFLNFGNK